MSEPGLLEQLLEWGLLSPEQIDALGRRPEDADEPPTLAEAIVQRGWLTRFQLDQAAAGKGRRLFVGAYVLLSPLGQGGMGQVFKARHRHMNRLVALKLMRKERLQSPDAVRRFYREVEAAGQLSHPNVVLTYDAGQAGKTWFVAMEYIDGPDLSRLVQERGVLPVEQACEYIRQAALGLQHAHEQGLVHRDIKPKNLVAAFNEDGSATVKVLDLGLARLSDSPPPRQTRGLTRLGQVLGTPAYLAPEQARDARTADVRADLYGLGCSLFFLLTGRPPFEAPTRGEMLRKHRREEPPSVRPTRPDAPAELDSLLQSLLAKKPERRPGAAAEVAAALAAFARRGRGGGTQAGQAAAGPPPATTAADAVIVRPRERRQAGGNRLLIGAGLAVGALSLAGGVCAWSSLPSAPPAGRNEVVLSSGSGRGVDDKGRRPGKGKGGKARAAEAPTRGGGKPEAPVGVSRQLTAAIEEAVRAGKATRTEPVGGGDRYYYEVPKGGGLLTGLEVGVGRRAGREVISSIRAIYQTGRGRIRGAQQGKPPRRTVTLEARPGYAVAGLTVTGGSRLHGLSLTFRAVNGRVLQRSMSYESEWAGGGEGKKRSLAGDGRLVVGIFGKVDSREDAAGGVGLVILPPGRDRGG
jgi:serine/threonine-protein kinase